MISIVIPVYNKEIYIEETIVSVLNQTFKEFELIVVNDGSTDNSLKIIQGFTDKRIKIINILNSGVSVARNTGIKSAKFDYIAFLDADDWWEDTFLEEIAELIKNHPKENIFASGRCRVFKDKVDLYQNEFLPPINETGLVDYIQVISKYLPPINSSNVVVRKTELFKAGLFKVGQKQHEDHDLWIRLAWNNLVVFSNKNLSFYRKEIDNSASSNYYEASDFLRYLKTILETKNIISRERNKYFRKYYLKFILITYIKNYEFYNRDQAIRLYKNIKEIINLPYSMVILLLNTVPYKGMYKVLKRR